MDLAILETNLVTGTFWAALLSFILFLTSIVTKKQDSGKAQITSYLGYAGMIITFITSIAALIVKATVTGHVPWSNFYESMVLMAALSTLLFLVIYQMYKQDIIGLVMSPGIVILIGIASILPRDFRGNEPLVPALASYWIKIHTTAMIVSYSVFLLSTTTAIAYLVFYFMSGKGISIGNIAGDKPSLNRLSLASTGPSIQNNDVAMMDTQRNEDISSNSPQRLSVMNDRLHFDNPNLALFDDLTYRLILLGFPILAFGIITGAMWANHAWGTYWSWDPKETAALMSWLFYAAYLHTRVGMHIKGKKSAIIAILGFAGIIFTYYGVNYLPGLHSYGFSVTN